MNRIRDLREKKGIEQKELAFDLKVSQPTISDWETGRKKPSNKSAINLASYFNVTLDYLLGISEINKSANGVWVPVLGRVQAGFPIEAVEDILDYEEISKEMAGTGDFFALQIKGSSMEPKFSEGDVVIVKKQPEVLNGEIAVVLINGNDATVKKFFKQENGINLVSTNSTFDPMFFSEKDVKTLPVTILGKVVELRAKF